MMSCPLPLPLPLLPPALHADFPPVHIGVKRGLNLFERGSDELLSQAAVMAPASDNNNQDLATKKAKLDSTNTVIAKTSRVVHIRNIPNEVSEAEIMQLGLPFGRVTNVLVLKGKNQAFIEMGDETAASTMVSVFHANPPPLRGRTVYVQYSNHRELKIDQNHAIANVTNALQAQDLTQSPTGSPLPLSIEHTNSNSQNASSNNTNNSSTTPPPLPSARPPTASHSSSSGPASVSNETITGTSNTASNSSITTTTTSACSSSPPTITTTTTTATSA